MPVPDVGSMQDVRAEVELSPRCIRLLIVAIKPESHCADKQIDQLKHLGVLGIPKMNAAIRPISPVVFCPNSTIQNQP